ncbi:NAD(P)H-binding protein [Luteipulveratus sp. YIM 133132]|uniref:SDR family oxidoreductase n=1 Tax=Luteipulveratus flavus TaxID=3031728 RepID=UPI0023B1F329|nr:NAD-dependent epimerase/dehydratase family protein [Luteipulveratus sp. YIM 133132]MDE9367709.1 NAD(P)H-binding protein [Luteipulveratus sp. YIM 133132]
MTDPTEPPAWVEGVPGIGRTPVLVTGGTGTLGGFVVAELERSQVPARVLTRTPLQPRTEQVYGDLRTGEGLPDAVEGVQAVVHCATHPTRPQEVDVDGTRRLLSVLSQVNPEAHVVHVSIVGAIAGPLPYYRAKVAAETAVTAWEGPRTIVRATQFHQLVERLTRVSVGPFGLGLHGLRFAPVDPVYVAGRLVDHALSEPRREPLELAGPEVLSAREIAVLTARVKGRPTPHVVTVPAVGAALRALSRGSNLPGPDAERGGLPYAEWLAAQMDS